LGSQKRILIILPLVMTLVATVSYSAPAGLAASTYIFDGSSPGALRQSTLDCASVGGLWANATATCTLNGSGSIASGSGLKVTPSAKMVVNFGAAFNISGRVLINGSAISNTGTITITSAGILTNTGTLRNNYGTIANAGTMSNGPNATISNFGVVLNNYGGTINNTGTVANNGLIQDNAGGTINNGPSGTIANSGTIATNCGGTIVNSGKLSGDPVVNTCKSPTPSSPAVPEFPFESLGIVAFAIMAIVVSLTRRPLSPKNRSP
jgi:hypothetical protein